MPERKNLVGSHVRAGTGGINQPACAIGTKKMSHIELAVARFAPDSAFQVLGILLCERPCHHGRDFRILPKVENLPSHLRVAYIELSALGALNLIGVFFKTVFWTSFLHCLQPGGFNELEQPGGAGCSGLCRWVE